MWHSRVHHPYFHSHDVKELKFIRLWLPDTTLLTIILPHINEMLDAKRAKAGAGRKSHRAAVDITAFFGYIFRYFLHGLQHKGHLVDSPVDIKDLKSRLMGDTRYEEVSAACIWSEKVIDDLHTDFNQRAPTNVTVGILINGDETVDAYFGSDAREDEIDRYFPGKPHPYGLCGYRAAVRLRFSGGRVTVAFCSIIPRQKWTPTAAALHLLNCVRPHQLGASHYILDAAFVTPDLLSQIDAMGASVTVSLKANRTAGYGALYTLATEGLREGEVRSYACGQYILQARRKQSASKKGGIPFHVVLSSGWQTPVAHIEPIKRLGSYDTAVYLWQNEPAATLAALLDIAAVGSAREVIRAKTGWDVLAPPPDKDGRVAWTVEALSEMSVSQLRALATITPGCAAPSQRAKEGLVTDIVKNHPHAKEASGRPARRRATAVNLVNLRDQIGRASSPKSDVLDFYNAEYGAVDEINQDIYRYILLNCHRSWPKLVGFTVLHAIFMNVWACFVEARAEAESRDPQGARVQAARHPRFGFDQFILNAAQQFLAEIGK